MSDAKVRFDNLAMDGDVPPGGEQTFSFNCPVLDRRCGELVIAGKTDLKRNGQNQDGGIAQWDWDGNREAPTFTPSVNCGKCWHGYIRKGRCVSVAGVDEPEIARKRT